MNRRLIGDSITDLKARAHFYHLTGDSHPSMSQPKLPEMEELARGLQDAADLKPSALLHPFEVVREYAAKHVKQNAFKKAKQQAKIIDFAATLAKGGRVYE